MSVYTQEEKDFLVKIGQIAVDAKAPAVVDAPKDEVK